MLQRGFLICFVGFVLVSFYSCASVGGLQDSGNIYTEDYNRMVEVVEQAIKSTGLSIEYAEESGGGEKFTIIFADRVTVGNQSVQQQQGEAIIEKVNDNETRVRINNPDYHFSVPDHQKKEYDRILTNRIEDQLNN